MRRGSVLLTVLVGTIVLTILLNVLAVSWVGARTRAVERDRRERAEAAARGGVRYAASMPPDFRGRLTLGDVAIDVGDAEIVAVCDGRIARARRAPDGPRDWRHE